MKMLIHFLPLCAAFGALKIAVSPVTLYTSSTALTSIALNEIDQSGPIHRRLASRKEGVCKHELLSDKVVA